MKILLAGDIHGKLKHLRYLMEQAKETDCKYIFALGDFGAWEHMPWGVEYFDKVSELAQEYSTDVYFLDGNHDKTSLLHEMYDHGEGFFLTCRPHLYYAPRGLVWWWGRKKFIALGGAYSVDKYERIKDERAIGNARGVDMSGTQWFPEEEMTDEQMDHILATVSSFEPTVDVMLTHDKPRASNPTWNRKDFPECEPNQRRIQKALTTLKPKLLVHGHLHFPYEDHVRHEEGWTRVVGLDADSDHAARPNPKWSWMVLDTDDI